jgi:hypothetical protein
MKGLLRLVMAFGDQPVFERHWILETDADDLRVTMGDGETATVKDGFTLTDTMQLTEAKEQG